jgi:hypothetical protein
LFLLHYGKSVAGGVEKSRGVCNKFNDNVFYSGKSYEKYKDFFNIEKGSEFCLEIFL